MQLTCNRFRMDFFISLPFGLVCVKSRKNTQCIFLNNMYLPISASMIMPWNSSFSVLLASLYLMDFANAKNPCKTEVSVPGMALRGFVFKKVPVTAPHMCDITCERETICQSYNYVIKVNGLNPGVPVVRVV